LRDSLRHLASAALVGAVLTGSAAAAEISGAGATFPYPIYAKWAEAYKTATGIGLNYQSIGSGGGIKQIEANTVDFGASDMPLTPDDLAKNGLQQFPPVIGGEVLVVNIPGVASDQMVLDGPTIANIYLGKIAKWNDPAIAKLNPSLKLPDMGIAVVHRSDGSGTTFIFTDYLSKVSAEWKDKVGENTSVEWPTGLGGKGNEGVSAIAARTRVPSAMSSTPTRCRTNSCTPSSSTRRARRSRRARRCFRRRPPMPIGRRRRDSTSSSPISRARKAGRSPARPSS